MAGEWQGQAREQGSLAREPVWTSGKVACCVLPAQGHRDKVGKGNDWQHRRKNNNKL